MKSIRFLALLLCAALLLPLVPVHAAQSGGSFYLTASTAGQTLIEPVAVPYTAGQTIRDALRGSGYAFGGIDTAFITDIEGVAGNFTVYYDGGAYSLDAIASPETVTAVVFSERERGFPALLDAVTELGRFRERTDHVQNYPAAQQAYAAALSGLRTADEAGLTTLLAALRSAVAEYEAILNGTKYPVTFTDTAGTAAQLTLTDSYGNVTQVQGLRAEVVAGEYTFSLSDGGANRVDGTLTVAGAVEKQVALPTGDWFGTIRLHNASGASAGAYPGTQDEKTHTAQFRVEDFRTLAYLYAERGVDAPADAALYSCYIGQNGKDYGDGSQPSNRKSWSSYQTALVSLLTAGMTDCEVRLEARSASGADTRIQSYTLRLHRVPTLASLAVVAVKNSYCCPVVDDSGVIEIHDGRHPVVERVLKDALFVPNDTYMGEKENRVAIITGPNMAGKSTYMRQVALITLMAQIGSFVPARAARIGVVDRIFTRIGASDDLAGGQSTFMVEMSEVAEILRQATAHSLLILDEIGRGTSTFDGMSIARAVLEFCADRKRLGAKTLFATHYHELTELEGTLAGVKNYNIAIKKRGEDLVFLRKIIPGGADRSYGIEVAKLAGLPKEVVSRAKKILEELEAGGSYIPPREEREQVSLDAIGEAEVLDALRRAQPDTMSPIEAMQLLYDLKKKLPN